MKDTFYFQHDYEPTSDPKIQALLGSWGGMGYGVYWRIVEMLHSNEDHELPLKPYIFQAIASQMLGSSTEIEAMIKSMISDYELFESQGEIFWSQRVKNNIAKMEEIREKRKKAGSKGGIARMDKVASAKQIVAKSSKIKENKIKETNTSSIEEVILSYWNSKKIIAHEKNPKLEGIIKTALNQFSEDQIKIGIDTYSEVLLNDKYLWSYKWGLSEFLSRKNGLLVFMDKKPEDYPIKNSYGKPEKKSLTQIVAENPDFI